MSRNRHGRQPVSAPAVEAPTEEQVVEQVEEKPVEKVVAEWRRCPLCYTGYGGVGRVTSTHNMKRYYQCQECGWRWRVNLCVRSVEWNVPTIDND
jgi:predicted RNA-binding Zn-ribbon protein involved in translation (DUF1610 family)